MKNKITVIVPFSNEENTIKKTIGKLLLQTISPDKIIFINSNSNDRTEKIIKKYKNKKFKIYSLKTKYPSDSKNLGIQIANTELVAFMDCDLNFPNDWLEKSYILLKKKKLDLVLGTCQLKGFNNFDKAIVINTYGYNKITPCIPGTLAKKNVFQKIGYFDQARSFYDVLWKARLYKSNIKFLINYGLKLNYFSYNYASSFLGLLKKSSLYIESEINLFYNWKTYIYISAPIILLTFAFINPFFLIYFYLLYLVSRFYKGIAKSKDNLRIFNLKILLLILITAKIIDLGKTYGSYKSLFRFIGINSIFAIFSFSLILVFYTPIFTLLGNNLAIHDKLDYADAIVVFSGDGSTSYRNSTYRDRTLEALKIYNQGYSKKILLSSGRDQSISDVDFIRSYLLSRNVDKTNVYLFEAYPTSTYENIKMVGDYLKINKINKIIFITALYHNKRAQLIWRHNYPDIKLIVPPINRNSTYWKQDLEKVKIICYEYLAIIHNKIRGYL
jgi:uncharacterized SAM-binding protein YcdF (DUF218 family)